jgi:hypothetical protein
MGKYRVMSIAWVRGAHGAAIHLFAFLLMAMAAAPVLAGGAGIAPQGFDHGRLSFSIEIKNVETPYRVLGIFVMPGETVAISSRAQGLRIEASAGRVSEIRERRWTWQAPREKGLHPLRIRNTQTGEVMTLNAFVMVPLSEAEDGVLNGYRIGAYPTEPFRGLDTYRAPQGLVEVTPELERVAIAPHFTLGQFLCKQADGYPKYVLVREALLVKLEKVLEEVNRRGIRTDGFVVMSGYRTPFYNQAIGNGPYSRHVYGAAADIYIDTTGDGQMDDINGDGRVDATDAAILFDIVEDLYKRPLQAALIGGIGQYGPRRPVRGPFVHVDVRDGVKARWGR